MPLRARGHYLDRNHHYYFEPFLKGLIEETSVAVGQGLERLNDAHVPCCDLKISRNSIDPIRELGNIGFAGLRERDFSRVICV